MSSVSLITPPSRAISTVSSIPTSGGERTDWNAVRGAFPILSRRIGSNPLVFLDSAASSQAPQSVIDRASSYRQLHHSNVHRGVHTLSQEATDQFEAARTAVSHFIGAPSSAECIFVRGATEGINLVAYSFLRPRLKPGDEVLVTEMEHHANIVPWQLICKEQGATLRVLPITDAGALRVDLLDEYLGERTRLFALVHISNVLGTVNPVKECIARAHAKGVPVLVDGCQAVPHMAVNVSDLDADFYTFSSHKMCGPTGVGVLFGKRSLLESMPPFMGGGDMISTVTFEETTFNELPHKFEAGTPAITEVIGLGEAVEFLTSVGLDSIAAREGYLLEYALAGLAKIEGLTYYGTIPGKSSIISFALEGVHHHDIGTILDKLGIAIRVGHHCAQPLMRRLGVEGCARASIAFYNNEEDLDLFVKGLEEVALLCR